MAADFSFVKVLFTDWEMDEETQGGGNCFYHSIVQQLKREDVKTFLKHLPREIF
jgi:hypothetical protein